MNNVYDHTILLNIWRVGITTLEIIQVSLELLDRTRGELLLPSWVDFSFAWIMKARDNCRTSELWDIIRRIPSLELCHVLLTLKSGNCRLSIFLFCRLLLEKKEAVMLEVESWLTHLQASTDDGGQGLVNVLEDLLWAFQQRGTADRLFKLAVRVGVYQDSYSRYLCFYQDLFGPEPTEFVQL